MSARLPRGASRWINMRAMNVRRVFRHAKLYRHKGTQARMLSSMHTGATRVRQAIALFREGGAACNDKSAVEVSEADE